MSVAVVRSRALRGLESPGVTVEVHLANGLPSFTLVGLADTEVKESRERDSAVRREAFTACSGSRARSPTWPAAMQSTWRTSPKRSSTGARWPRPMRSIVAPAPPRRSGLGAQPGFRKPRSLGKFLRFGNTVSRFASLTPNQRPSVLPIVSTEVTGR